MNRRKLAELTSGLGALVLGIGLGALGAPWIGRAAAPIAAVGLVAHAFGMWDGHRQDARPDGIYVVAPGGLLEAGRHHVLETDAEILADGLHCGADGARLGIGPTGHVIGRGPLLERAQAVCVAAARPL